MKICNYWSESNSLIYFYTVLNKNWKNYWSELKVLLVLCRRTGAHCEVLGRRTGAFIVIQKCSYIVLDHYTKVFLEFSERHFPCL
jgi:hypothetical protein